MAQSSKDNTVVGVFNDYSTAERVAQELTDAGIPRESIDLKSNFMTSAAGRSVNPDERHEGGLSGFLRRLVGSEESAPEVDNYSEAVRRGNAVMCVTGTPSQIDETVEIMNSAGAVDIDRHVERFRETGYERYDPNAPPYSFEESASERERFRDAGEGSSVPVLEEELQIGKRVVRRGGVRVYSRVVEEPVSENIELREEHVRVERRPVNRPVNSEDANRFREQSIEVVETVEEPVVQKRTRVREEVVVGKETTRRTQEIRDKVRRTEVEIEQLGGGGDYTEDFRRDWQERYASSGETYETYEPAYNYGYRSASDDRYQGKNWSDVEDTLRTDYLRNNPNSTWDRAKGAVRYGWEKVTGKR